MQKYTFTGEDFKAVLQTPAWKIGLLRSSERFRTLTCFERHLCTDEAFVLLSGTACLYVKDEQENVTKTPMEKNAVYNVSKGEWHHIVVDEETTVLVVENADTSKENTEKIYL